MYTTKNAVRWNDTGMPRPIVCEPGHLIKEVVGAGICRNRGEPLHIREMLRRRSDGTQENVVNHLAGNLENHSNLCNLMSCIPVSCTDSMIHQTHH